MVSCSDRQFADLLLMLRSHGWSRTCRPHGIENWSTNTRSTTFTHPLSFTSRDLTSVRRISMPSRHRTTAQARLDDRAATGQSQSVPRTMGKRFYTQRPPAQQSRKVFFVRPAHDSLINANASSGHWSTRWGNANFLPVISDYIVLDEPLREGQFPRGGPGPSLPDFFLPNHASMTDQDVLHISRIVLEAAR